MWNKEKYFKMRECYTGTCIYTKNEVEGISIGPGQHYRVDRSLFNRLLCDCLHCKEEEKMQCYFPSCLILYMEIKFTAMHIIFLTPYILPSSKNTLQVIKCIIILLINKVTHISKYFFP